MATDAVNKPAVICYFANGPVINENLTLQCEHTKKARTYSFNAENGVVFLGQATTSLADDDYDYALCARDPATGLMEFMDADLVTFHPHFARSADRLIDIKPEATEKTFMEKKADMVMEFGGKRQKAVMAKQMNILSTDALAQNMSLAAATKEDSLALTPDQKGLLSGGKASVPISSAIPPYNRSASSPKAVYSIESFLFSHELEPLKLIAADWYNNKTAELLSTEGHSAFIVDLYTRTLPVDPNTRLNVACYMIYMSALVTLKHDMGASKRKVDLGAISNQLIPDCLRERIRREFLESSSNLTNLLKSNACGVSVALRKKLLCHLMVMALLFNGLKLKLDRFVNEWNQSKPMLVEVAKAIGCRVDKDSAGDTAILVGPPKADMKRTPMKRR